MVATKVSPCALELIERSIAQYHDGREKRAFLISILHIPHVYIKHIINHIYTDFWSLYVTVFLMPGGCGGGGMLLIFK